ncbi:hypothetical protein QBC37DRAFT_390155 [Rhypophila decipiens]|uniref:Uncharacterized protein n=1 Tax=Rhypophila decipiens TaxID=261697 RepID=A0AAN6Y7J6_9PEZI|nr:hypothetical protein QBC37DRAFT_390155 [Rhypophila decipiens]
MLQATVLYGMVGLAAIADAAVAVAERGLTCILPNACLFQVKAAALPLGPNGRADCSSFLRTTVTPAAPTTTVVNTVTNTNTVTITSTSTSTNILTESTTVTETVTVGGGGSLRRRAPAKIANPLAAADAAVPAPVQVVRRQATATPTAIPHYASACKSGAAYASACSCIGVHKTTTTAPAPPRSTVSSTTTVATTVTTTVTVIVTTATTTTATITSTTTTTTITTTAPTITPTANLIIRPYNSALDCDETLAAPDIVIPSGECAGVPNQPSVKFLAYTPPVQPGCSCVVEFHNDDFCTDLFSTQSPTSTDCFDVSFVYSLRLVCTCA